MKTRSKVLLLIVSALALVIATIFGTLAYLTDTETVTNTFTVGNIDIKLDEAPVDKNGEVIQGERVDGNEYHLLPGHFYIKDPTVTIKPGSEESYVRMLVTVTCSAELDGIFAYHGGVHSDNKEYHEKDKLLLENIFTGYNEDKWVCVGNTENANNTRTYEFRYIGGTKFYTVDGVAATEEAKKLEALFTGFTVPSFFTKEDLAKLAPNLDGTPKFKIDVVAHAIQADGFKPADSATPDKIAAAVDAAWAAFDGQCPAETTAAD